MALIFILDLLYFVALFHVYLWFFSSCRVPWKKFPLSLSEPQKRPFLRNNTNVSLSKPKRRRFFFGFWEIWAKYLIHKTINFFQMELVFNVNYLIFFLGLFLGLFSNFPRVRISELRFGLKISAKLKRCLNLEILHFGIAYACRKHSLDAKYETQIQMRYDLYPPALFASRSSQNRLMSTSKKQNFIFWPSIINILGVKASSSKQSDPANIR